MPLSFHSCLGASRVVERRGKWSGGALGNLKRGFWPLFLNKKYKMFSLSWKKEMTASEGRFYSVMVFQRMVAKERLLGDRW